MKNLIKILGSLSVIICLASAAAAQQGYPEMSRGRDDSSYTFPAAPAPVATIAKLSPKAGGNSPVDNKSADADDDDKDNAKPSVSHVEHVDAPEAAADDFTLVGGDVLQVTVWKEDSLDREVLVLPDGTITFPLIGTMAVKGMTPQMVQASIKHKLKSLIPDASVTVTVKAPLGHTVSVLGQVLKPGEFVMSHRMGVMQALSEAGGLTPYASEGHITVLRYIDGKKTSIDFPYSDVATGRHLEKDIDLKPGDVVFVGTAGLL